MIHPGITSRNHCWKGSLLFLPPQFFFSFLIRAEGMTDDNFFLGDSDSSVALVTLAVSFCPAGWCGDGGGCQSSQFPDPCVKA